MFTEQEIAAKMEAPPRYQELLDSKFKDFLENLARECIPCGKTIHINGVVCFTNSDVKTEQIKLTVNETITSEQPPVPQMPSHEPNPEGQAHSDKAGKRSLEAEPIATSRKRRKGTPIKYVETVDRDDDEEVSNSTLQTKTTSPDPAQNTPLFSEEKDHSTNSDDQRRRAAVEMYAECNVYDHPVSNPSADNMVNHTDANGSLDAMPQPTDDAYGDKGYTCSKAGCQMKFSRFMELKAHAIEKHKSIPCPICQKLNTSNNYKRHMDIVHFGKNKHPCPDCGSKFSRQDTMKEHRLTHSQSYQERKCRRCGKECRESKQMLSHLKQCFVRHRTKSGSIDESNLPSQQMDTTGLFNQNFLTVANFQNVPQIAAMQSAIAHQAFMIAYRPYIPAPPTAPMDSDRTLPESANSTHSRPELAEDLSNAPLDLKMRPSNVSTELAKCAPASQKDQADESLESDEKQADKATTDHNTE